MLEVLNGVALVGRDVQVAVGLVGAERPQDADFGSPLFASGVCGG